MKGDGSIFPAKGKDGKQQRNVWRVRVSLGLDPQTGKYRTSTRTVHGSKTDARRELERMKAEIAGGLDPTAKPQTFGAFAYEWLDQRVTNGEILPRTGKRYRAALDALEPIHGARLDKITPRMLDAAYSAIVASGKAAGTADKSHTVAHLVFDRAVKYGMVAANPCDKATPPKGRAGERRSLDREQAAKLRADLLDAYAAEVEACEEKERRQYERGNTSRACVHGVRGASCCMAALVALATGARRGELLALTWGALDFDAGSVTIAASLNPDMTVKDPKTAAGVRTVALDAATVDALKAWRVFQAAQMLKIGVRMDKAAPVFCNSEGGYIGPDNFTAWWRGFAEAHGLAGVTFHELRHTHATLLLGNGVDVKTVQTRLGHANAGITLNTYAHAIPANDEQAAAALAALLDQTPGKEAKRA